MWEWFGDTSLNKAAEDLFKMVGQFTVTDQMNPVEVSDRLVELVEAETTTENNFVPADIKERLGM